MLIAHDRYRVLRVCRESFSEPGRLSRNTVPGQGVPERFSTHSDQICARLQEVDNMATGLDTA